MERITMLTGFRPLWWRNCWCCHGNFRPSLLPPCECSL